MPKLDLYTITGKSTEKIDLPPEIFGVKINSPLMAQAVRVYLSNQRKAHAHAKTRGQVTGSTRKIFRQKGTGHARHGSLSAPIFVGGGMAHGPSGEQNYKLTMSQKMKKAALFSALTSKFTAKEILVLKVPEKLLPKTQEMVKIFKNLELKVSSKISLILADKNENITRAGRNIAGVKLMKANNLNTYEVLNGGKLIFMDNSLPVLQATYLPQDTPVKPAPKTTPVLKTKIIAKTKSKTKTK